MNELPSELLSQMASYLWFKDLLSLSLTSKKIHHRLHSDGFFWIDLLDSILRSLYYDPPVHIRSDLLQLSQNYSTHDFVAFLKQILLTIPTFWPRTVDTKIFNTYRGPDHLRIIELENNPQRNYVLFDGSIDDGVRSIVANDCFPYLPIETDDLIVSLPFTKVVATELMTQQNGAETISLFTSGKVVCSEVGYFECMIHQSCFPPEALYLSSSQDLSSRTSISIGLACPPFALKGQFPGVDNFSLGYRSDDGAFYQGGYTGIQFGAEPYGPGDIVGCGLVYPPLDRQGKGKLFFTRNGHIQGRILDIASSNFFCIPWFPVIVSIMFRLS